MDPHPEHHEHQHQAPALHVNIANTTTAPPLATLADIDEVLFRLADTAHALAALPLTLPISLAPPTDLAHALPAHTVPLPVLRQGLFRALDNTWRVYSRLSDWWVLVNHSASPSPPPPPPPSRSRPTSSSDASQSSQYSDNDDNGDAHEEGMIEVGTGDRHAAISSSSQATAIQRQLQQQQQQHQVPGGDDSNGQPLSVPGSQEEQQQQQSPPRSTSLLHCGNDALLSPETRDILERHAAAAAASSTDRRRRRTSSSHHHQASSSSSNASASTRPEGRCLACNATWSVQWRRGPYGEGTLCHACGMHWKHKQRIAMEAALISGGEAATLKDSGYVSRPSQGSPRNGGSGGTEDEDGIEDD
ncbi:hypothetical protein BC828DRAFT_382053 [Blastocladiella britannica]|nr:hypothetical protein BC828DRAFT_382053 [Blastocladiella britannica]